MFIYSYVGYGATAECSLPNAQDKVQAIIKVYSPVRFYVVWLVLGTTMHEYVDDQRIRGRMCWKRYTGIGFKVLVIL